MQLGTEPATFRLEVQGLNQLCQRMPVDLVPIFARFIPYCLYMQIYHVRNPFM